MTDALTPTATAVAAPTSETVRPVRIAMLTCSVFETDARVQRAARRLAERGHEVDLFCLRDRSLRPADRIGRIRFHRLDMSRDRSGAMRSLTDYAVFFLWALASVSVRHVRRRYRVVYAHNMPNFMVFAGIVPRLTGAKVVLDVHDPGLELFETIRARPLTPWLRSAVLAEERTSVRFSDALITVNEPMRERIRERTGTDRPVSVVMNLPDPPGVGPDQDGGAEEGVQRLVYSGSVTSRHGVDLILRAIALLAPDHPDLRLRLLGDGPYLDALRQLARDLGITDRVEFLGAAAVKDVATYLRGATAGLSTQREDDFGSLVFSMKVPEYISLGLPVVCAATRTMRHYFCEDEVFFFRPGDADDLARAIREVLEGPGEARRRLLRGQRKLDQLDRVGQQAALVETVERLVGGQER